MAFQDLRIISNFLHKWLLTNKNITSPASWESIYSHWNPQIYLVADCSSGLSQTSDECERLHVGSVFFTVITLQPLSVISEAITITFGETLNFKCPETGNYFLVQNFCPWRGSSWQLVFKVAAKISTSFSVKEVFKCILVCPYYMKANLKNKNHQLCSSLSNGLTLALPGNVD